MLVFFKEEQTSGLPLRELGWPSSRFGGVPMSRSRTRQRPRSRRADVLQKPRGTFHPRVQKVGPDHFGIVAVDCAKARSKWMLADFYGNILVRPTPLAHNRPALDAAVDRLRQAVHD